MERWFTITNNGIFNINEILYVIKLSDDQVRFGFKGGHVLDLRVDLEEGGGIDGIFKALATLFEEESAGGE